MYFLQPKLTSPCHKKVNLSDFMKLNLDTQWTPVHFFSCFFLAYFIYVVRKFMKGTCIAP